MQGDLTYKALKDEFRLTYDSDEWGHVMHWWFTVADELYWNRRPAVWLPEDWQFRPSPIGPVNDPDDYATGCVTETETDDLLRFGHLLHRYAAKLKQAGKDY
jgi:hypothetical protein